jgi:hypothetical protein
MDDDLQPFSLCFLINSKPESMQRHESAGEVIVGCAKGTLIVFDIKTKRRAMAVVQGMHVPQMNNQAHQPTPPLGLAEARRMSVKENEPLLYI